jgi:hypothetical protein
MSIKPLALAFHTGLLPGVLILWYGDSAMFRFLLPVGVLHVCVLWTIGRRLKIPLDRQAVSSLHRAGFLHTLLGLGAAVMAVAHAWEQGQIIVAPVTSALSPMGAALIPHVLGVWLGHTIDLKSFGGDDSDVGRKIEESAHSVLCALARVQAAANDFSTHVEAATRSSTDAARRVVETVGTLRAVTHDSAEAAADFRRLIEDIAKTTGQIHIVHKQIVDVVHSCLVRLEREEMRA